MELGDGKESRWKKLKGKKSQKYNGKFFEWGSTDKAIYWQVPNPPIRLKVVYRLQINLKLSLNPHCIPRYDSQRLTFRLYWKSVLHLRNSWIKSSQKSCCSGFNLTHIKGYILKKKVQSDFFHASDSWVCGIAGWSRCRAAKGHNALAVFHHLQCLEQCDQVNRKTYPRSIKIYPILRPSYSWHTKRRPRNLNCLSAYEANDRGRRKSNLRVS